jgi:hypothetical protein
VGRLGQDDLFSKQADDVGLLALFESLPKLGHCTVPRIGHHERVQ